jgi:hypothetical protein
MLHRLKYFYCSPVCGNVLLKETVKLLMQHILPGSNVEIPESIVTVLLNSKGFFLLTKTHVIVFYVRIKI